MTNRSHVVMMILFAIFGRIEPFTNNICDVIKLKKSIPSHLVATTTTSLEAISKRKSVILDGADFISIASMLFKSEKGGLASSDFPSKPAGYMTFVTGTNDKKERFLGVQKEVNETNNNSRDEDKIVEVEQGVYLHVDSMVDIPKGISDNDAISTAAAAFSVHFGLGEKTKKSVVLGGGDYACFLAKALDRLGNDVWLVTTRPMQLANTPLNPIRDTNITAMPPANPDEDDKGFSEVVGEFDTIIDTLEDEGKLEKVKNLEEGAKRVFGEVGVSSKLLRENKCKRYISTVTKSQRLVLKEGLLFARGAVVDYQKEIEKTKLNSEDFLCLPPPAEYGQTLQQLFDNKILYPMVGNENGSHKNKKTFVRGCSFPDYAEVEIWPQDSTDGAAVRYGFPAIGELTDEKKTAELEARVDEMMATKKATRKKNAPSNPFVMEIESLTDIRKEIMEQNKTGVLFISAPYCKLCKSMGPKYARMARLSKEEKKSDIFFAKTTSVGKQWKQIIFSLKIDSVPTFVLFRDGKMYCDPFGVSKLPSTELNAAIEALELGKEWDPKTIKESELETEERTYIS